jgi:aldose 1-epimerase
MTFVAKNIGDSTAPFGFGCHPYFSVGDPIVDETVLTVPARRYLPLDNTLTVKPDPLPVDGTPFDFRKPVRVGATELDTTLTDLVRDDAGQVVVTYSSADGATSVTCTYDETIGFVQLFSGDMLPADRRTSLAIEPLTCAPNAFNNGLGLAHVPPGGSVRVRWTLSA